MKASILKLKRIEKGYSIENVCDDLNISKMTIIKFENIERLKESKTIQNLEKACNYFGIKNLAEFFAGSEYIPMDEHRRILSEKDGQILQLEKGVNNPTGAA